jgi:Protein of unknown function (DUF2846)
VELWKLAKILAAVTLTVLTMQSCALRPRFNDLISKEETAKAVAFRVVNAETREPIAGASVELGDGPYRVRLTSDAQGVVNLPVGKKYRDDNSIIAVTLAAGLPQYELVPLAAGEAVPVPSAEAAPTSAPYVPPPGAAAAAPAGKKSMEFKPQNAANALVVVYRNTSGTLGSGSMVGGTLKVDKEAVGDVAHDTYLVVELAPGKHTVTAQSMAGESNWLVTLAAGQVEYAQLQPLPFRLVAKSANEALGEMRADAETLSQSARVNLGAPSESK